MKSVKTNRARNYAIKALTPLIRAGSKTPSLYPKIAAAMSDLSDESFHRQEVAAWLHRDIDKRIEPRLGAGLLLIKVGGIILERAKKKADKDRRKKALAKNGHEIGGPYDVET